VTRRKHAPSIEVVSLVTNMNKKTNYKFWYRLWFVAAALSFLGAIYPLNVAQRNAEHRRLSIVMGVLYLSIAASHKKKYEKSLIEAPAIPSDTRISQ
jgi:hypothetical protein